MQQASTIDVQMSPKASELFSPNLVWLEFFFLSCCAILVLFAPPSVLNVLCVSTFALLWLSISRSIAEYRNTKTLSRKGWMLKLVTWGYPVLPWISLALKQYTNMPSLSELVFWGALLLISVIAVMPRRIEVGRFGDDKQQRLSALQAAAKERYRGWVTIFVIGLAVMVGLWVILSTTMSASA